MHNTLCDMKTTTLYKKKFFNLLLILCMSSMSFIQAQNVLIIYDDTTTNPNTLALKSALDSEGFTTTFSSVPETQWNNTNPSIDSFDAVVHLNGTTYAQEMPQQGQIAITDFVQNNGGLYVGFEWNAYLAGENMMQDMLELILFTRGSGSNGALTLDLEPSQVTNPIMANVPASFNVSAGKNKGSIKAFTTQPATVLMKDGAYDAVAYRGFGNGHVLGFHHAGNFMDYPVLADNNIQKIITNFITHYYNTLSVPSVSQDATTKITLYPNPATNTIQLKGLNKHVNYEVYSILGKQVLKGRVGEFDTINISELQTGVYMIKIEDTTLKFIKR